MLTIRLARVGKKNKAQFKIMLQEHSVAPGGRHIEVLGSYDPHQKKAVLKEERIKYWIEKGAQASDTVHNLLVSKNVISDKKRAVKLPQKMEEVKAEPASPAGEEKTESADAKAMADKEVKDEEKVEEVKKEESSEGAKQEEIKSE